MSLSTLYIGTTAEYPLRLHAGAAVLVSGVDVIEQSVRDILSIGLGERFFLPDYGNRISSVLFEPNDDVLRQLMSTVVEDALEKWETRVKMENFEILSNDDEVLECRISVLIKKSNEIHSFVHPFYKTLIH